MWGHASQWRWLAVAPGSVSFRGHGSSSFRPNENPPNYDGTCRNLIRSEARSDDLRIQRRKVRSIKLAILYPPFLVVQHGATLRHPTSRADWPCLGCFLHTPRTERPTSGIRRETKGNLAWNKTKREYCRSSRGGDIFNRKTPCQPCPPHTSNNTYPSSHSCGPHTLDSLGDAHIGGFELVEGQADDGGGGVDGPGEELAHARHPLFGDVIDDDVLEAGVRVDEDGGAQDGVERRVQRAGREGGDGERDQGAGDQPVKGPVVGPVGWGRGRYGGGIVYYKSEVLVRRETEGVACWCCCRGSSRCCRGKCAHTCAVNVLCSAT